MIAGEDEPGHGSLGRFDVALTPVGHYSKIPASQIRNPKEGEMLPRLTSRHLLLILALPAVISTSGCGVRYSLNREVINAFDLSEDDLMQIQYELKGGIVTGVSQKARPG